jgi:PTS system mannose-specific IIA component
MIGTLIVTQGGLAREFLAAAREIAGELTQFEAVSLEWSDGVDEARSKVSQALARVDSGEGVLVLADTFGATPCNVALGFFCSGRVEVISGVNLPMVVRLACRDSRETMDLAEAARWLQTKGRQSIQIASELSRRRNGAPPGAAPDPAAERVEVEVDAGDRA